MSALDLIDILAGLDRLERDVIASGRAGLRDGMILMEQTAQDTTAYGNQTGANRGGTVGYVPGTNDDRFARAVAVVETRNPGASEVVSKNGDPDGLLGVLTTPTTYAADLEKNQGGQRAYVEPALVSDMHIVTATIAEAIRTTRR